MLGLSISLAFILTLHIYFGTSQYFDCEGQKFDVKLPSNNETECHVFYICRNETHLVWNECTDGKHFNVRYSSDDDVCVHPDVALCAENLRELRCINNNDLLSHPTNCSRFFRCETGSPIVDICPDHLHFSNVYQSCVAPQYAYCDQSPGPVCTIFDDPMRPTLLPDPSDCAAFFKCFNGRLIPMLCPTSLYFSEEKQRCEFPFNVKCRNGVGRNMF